MKISEYYAILIIFLLVSIYGPTTKKLLLWITKYVLLESLIYALAVMIPLSTKWGTIHLKYGLARIITIQESEPNSWEDTMKDEIDRKRYPRMPRHDVHCALWGPPCRDVARHFVQRWNYAKGSKALNEQAIPLLLPQHQMVIPHYMGKGREMELDDNNEESKHTEMTRSSSLTCSSSYQDVPLLMPQDADWPDATMIVPKLNGSNPLHDSPNKSAFFFRKRKFEPLIPDMPMRDFVDDINTLDPHNEFSSHAIHPDLEVSEREWWEDQEQGANVVFADETVHVGPRVSCHC